jgi:hypothetical protein
MTGVLQGFVGADGLQDVKAGHAGHHQVQQQHVGLVLADQLQGHARVVAGHETGVAGVFQVGLDDVGHHGLVVHHHDQGAIPRGRHRHEVSAHAVIPSGASRTMR